MHNGAAALLTGLAIYFLWHSNPIWAIAVGAGALIWLWYRLALKHPHTAVFIMSFFRALLRK